MPRVTKVAISLPGELLQQIEGLRAVRGESRSEFFRRAAEALIDTDREATLDEQYAAGYLAEPEELDEGLFAAGMIAQASEPWEGEEPT